MKRATSWSVPCRRALVLAALAMAGGAAAPTAAGATFSVTTEPPGAATWADAVTLIVRGTSTTPCGAAAVSMRREVGFHPRTHLRFRLEETCQLAGAPRQEPFEITHALGRLPPGDYQLIARQIHGQAAAASAPLLVAEVGTAVIEPVSPPTSDRPLALRVRAFGCPSGGTVEVAGRVVTFRYSSLCAPTARGAVFELEREAPPLPIGVYELRAIDNHDYRAEYLARTEVEVVDAGSCLPSDTRLCLHDGHFSVSATWRDFAGRTGVARPSVLPGNDGSGLLWFFDAENPEVTVKVLDGCGLNQRWWVFVASGSSVEYEVTVTDARTGAQRKYANGLGEQAPLVTDVDAFGGCGGAGP